ncbi:hypothetical protein ACSBR1_029351 [Camellia fascicularis]
MDDEIQEKKSSTIGPGKSSLPTRRKGIRDMDRSWMLISDRFSQPYVDGVNSFIEFAKVHLGEGREIKCPCINCCNFYKQKYDIVKAHLLISGMIVSYTTWLEHGELLEHNNLDESNGENDEDEDEYDELIEDYQRGNFMEGDTLEREDPMEIYVDDEVKLTFHGLVQHYIKLSELEKNRKLTDLLHALDFDQVVIFVKSVSVKSVSRATELNKLLVECNFPSICIHSGMSQEERKVKPQKEKGKTSEGRKQLSSVRVIQRNLVYIVGLPLNLADEDLLQRREYFGKYGKVLKVSLSRTAAGAIQHFANNTCSVCWDFILQGMLWNHKVLSCLAEKCDFGLPKLIPANMTHVSTRVVGTILATLLPTLMANIGHFDESDKTIDGRGAPVNIIHGAGINPQFVKNSDRDGISNIFRTSIIWIDHVLMSNYRDGLVDAVEGSTGITISNSHFTDHNKVMLFRAHDSTSKDKIMQVRIAFNHFGNRLIQRMTKCRWGFIHVINNDYTHWNMYAIEGYQEKRMLVRQYRRIGHGGHSEIFMMNGAFFVESGDSQGAQKTFTNVENKAKIIVALGTSVTMITCFTGVLACFSEKPH